MWVRSTCNLMNTNDICTKSVVFHPAADVSRRYISNTNFNLKACLIFQHQQVLFPILVYITWYSTVLPKSIHLTVSFLPSKHLLLPCSIHFWSLLVSSSFSSFHFFIWFPSTFVLFFFFHFSFMMLTTLIKLVYMYMFLISFTTI